MRSSLGTWKRRPPHERGRRRTIRLSVTSWGGGNMRQILRAAPLVAVTALVLAGFAGAANPGILVNVGSPQSPFAQNKQNEPALAVDANHPNVLVAGAND